MRNGRGEMMFKLVSLRGATATKQSKKRLLRPSTGSGLALSKRKRVEGLRSLRSLAMTPLVVFLFLILLLFFFEAKAQTTPAADWPMLAHDERHTGSSPDQPNPPYVLKWYRDFFDKSKNPEPEAIYDGIQLVISNGLIYFGTSRGNFYALDNSNGATRWQVKLQGKIMTTAAVFGDNVYVGAGRSMYVLNKTTGDILWKFETGKTTLLSSPIVVGNRVYFGSPDGNFYALNTNPSNPNDPNSILSWKYEVGYPILQPAAFANNKVYFAAQDLKVYALDASNGILRWVSSKIPGTTFSEHYPVVSNGLLMIRSKPADITEGTMYKNGILAREEALLASWATGMTPAAYKTCANTGPSYRGGCITGDETGSSQQLVSEQNSIRNYLTQNPQNQTFFAFDLETGQPKYSQPVPVLYCDANGTLPPPPVVHKKTDGLEDVYTPYRSFYSNLDLIYTWSIFAGLGKFNPGDGSINLLNSATGPRGSLMMICDEYTGFSMGGSRLFSKHWYSMSSMDVNDPRPEDVAPQTGEQNLLSHLGITNRDIPFGLGGAGTAGGAFGTGGHFSTGPVISEKTVYGHFYSVIFAIGGQ